MIQKSTLGFKNFYTGRLLVPVERLVEFDKNKG